MLLRRPRQENPVSSSNLRGRWPIVPVSQPITSLRFPSLVNCTSYHLPTIFRQAVDLAWRVSFFVVWHRPLHDWVWLPLSWLLWSPRSIQSKMDSHAFRIVSSSAKFVSGCIGCAFSSTPSICHRTVFTSVTVVATCSAVVDELLALVCS